MQLPWHSSAAMQHASPVFGQEGVQSRLHGLQVYFSVYEQLKTSLSYRARGHDWIKPPAIHMGAACGAGAACAAFSNPLFVVKTRLQTQHLGLKTARAVGPLYKGTFDALTRIAREEGFAGLYRCEKAQCVMSHKILSALASAVELYTCTCP